MKTYKFVLSLLVALLPVAVFGAASDLKLPQKNSANTAWADVVIAPAANGVLTFDSGKVPTSTASTGTGSVVRASSPTLVTPAIGAATGTSLTLTGALTDLGGTIAAQRNALAPAQSLSCAGDAGTSFPAQSLGTAAWTQAMVINQTSIRSGGDNTYLTGGSGLSPQIFLQDTTNVLKIYDGSAVLSSGTTIPLNVPVSIVVTGDKTNVKFFVNGVLVATVAEATANYTGTLTAFAKAGGPGSYLIGTGRLIGILNRALSDAEALQVYQTGALPASDFHSSGASNTSIITGDNSTFASNTGFWSLNGSTAISGGVLSIPNGSTDFITRPSLLTVGKRYRFKAGTITGNMQIGVGVPTTALVSGGSVDVIATGTELGIGSPSGQTGTLDSIEIFPAGALVAPDPAQLGSGNYWYDVSGNGNTITKDASVNWTLPWSGKIPAGAVAQGTFTADLGTNAANYLKATGTAAQTTVRIENTGSGGGSWDINSFKTSGGFSIAEAGVADALTIAKTTQAAVFAGSVAVAGTSVIKGVRTATANLSQDGIASGSSFNTGITITGVAAGDSIIVCMNDNSHVPAGCTLSAICNGANSANVIFYNGSGSTITGLTSRSVRVTVFSF